MTNILICANAIIVSKETSKLLLVKRASNRVEASKWSLAGGTVEFQEKLEDALLRELKEELSIEVIKAKFFDYHEYITDKLHAVAFYFVVKISENTQFKLNDELTEYKWVKNVDDELAFEQNIIVDKYLNS